MYDVYFKGFNFIDQMSIPAVGNLSRSGAYFSCTYDELIKQASRVSQNQVRIFEIHLFRQPSFFVHTTAWSLKSKYMGFRGPVLWNRRSGEPSRGA